MLFNEYYDYNYFQNERKKLAMTFGKVSYIIYWLRPYTLWWAFHKLNLCENIKKKV